MVFKKQLNEQGPYIGQDGKRYEVLSCERTESKEWYETGEYITQEIEGETVQIPVMAQRVVINKGWDSFENKDEAVKSYGLTEYIGA